MLLGVDTNNYHAGKSVGKRGSAPVSLTSPLRNVDYSSWPIVAQEGETRSAGGMFSAFSLRNASMSLAILGANDAYPARAKRWHQCLTSTLEESDWTNEEVSQSNASPLLLRGQRLEEHGR